jgi:hypothetical protein
MHVSKEFVGKLISVQVGRPLYMIDYAAHFKFKDRTFLAGEPVMNGEKPLAMDIIIGSEVVEVLDDNITLKKPGAKNHSDRAHPEHRRSLGVRVRQLARRHQARAASFARARRCACLEDHPLMAEQESDPDRLLRVGAIIVDLKKAIEGKPIADIQTALANTIAQLCLSFPGENADRLFLNTLDTCMEVYRDMSNHSLRDQDQGLS